MAWISPGTAVAGAVATAAFINVYRDDLNELRTGGIAIASQASLDFIFASSATQFGRLVKGSGLQVIRLNSGATAYEFATPAAGLGGAGYTPTLANVDNTVTATDIVTWTVSDMANGDIMLACVQAKAKQNTGANAGWTLKLYWGASSVTYFTATNSWGNNASEQESLVILASMMRVGADLIIQGNAATGNTLFSGHAGTNFSNTGIPYSRIVAPTFGSSQTVKIEATLSVADLTFYFKPQQANIFRIAKA